jgi:beta-mannanase
VSAGLNPGGGSLSKLRLGRSSMAIIAVLGTAVAALLLLQAVLSGRGHVARSGPWPEGVPASASVDIGVVTLPLARNSSRAWEPADLGTVNAFEQAIRRHASVVMWYGDWAHRTPLLQQLEAVGARGSMPEITWEPWDASTPVRDQPRYRLRGIIGGRYDPYIRTWARTIAAFGRPVRLRFAQEMNGGWYPWSEAANGNRPHEFVEAWRHVHDLFAREGATNVEWVWSPASITMHAEQYPGTAYVDLVSLSIFNGGTELRYRRWRPFGAALERSLQGVRGIAPDKPVEISEVGCAEEGGNKAGWVRQLFAWLPQHPEITSLIWFELQKGSDWRIESSPAAATAYADSVDAPRYR